MSTFVLFRSAFVSGAPLEAQILAHQGLLTSIRDATGSKPLAQTFLKEQVLKVTSSNLTGSLLFVTRWTCS